VERHNPYKNTAATQIHKVTIAWNPLTIQPDGASNP